MSTVDTAPPSAELQLTDDTPAIFMTRDKDTVPAVVSVPGSSNFNLSLFNVTAIGTVKPAVPGTLTLVLLGISKEDANNAPTSPASWLPLASSMAEPIGGEGELAETMWMIQGTNLMIFTGSGRMQGTFQSNVANNYQAPIDLEQRPGDITDSDPLYIFAVAARFTPNEPPASRVRQPDERQGAGIGRAAEEDVICSANLVNFTVSA